MYCHLVIVDAAARPGANLPADLGRLMNTSTPLVAASERLQTLVQIGSRSVCLLPTLIFIKAKYILTFLATPAEKSAVITNTHIHSLACAASNRNLMRN